MLHLKIMDIFATDPGPSFPPKAGDRKTSIALLSPRFMGCKQGRTRVGLIMRFRMRSRFSGFGSSNVGQ